MSNPLNAPKEGFDVNQLFEHEICWRERYVWLKENGYLLRPRYNPEWVPSWKNTKKWWLTCEDGQILNVQHILMDATRISDGTHVMLKVLDASNESEMEFYKFFSEEPQKSDLRNHSIPYHGFLKIPETEEVMVALPILFHWDEPDFETIGEVIDFFRQIFEGLEFMHSLHIAHNDIKRNNIMMDAAPLYDYPIHPINRDWNRDFTRWIKPGKRTLRPVKYIHIDFGHMCRYNPEVEAPTIPVGPHGYGGDLSVPEFKTQANSLVNPFPVDVYRIANVIRVCFIDGDETGDGIMRGFDFMQPLLDDMCQDDPTKRPTMSEVVSRFDELVKGLPWWKLRARVIEVEEPRLIRLFRFPVHWTKQAFRIVRRIPAVPRFISG